MRTTASFAVVKDATFRDGTIEVDLAGQPASGAGEGARGFIGIACRLQADGVAMWVGPGTEGDFANLKITARSRAESRPLSQRDPLAASR